MSPVEKELIEFLGLIPRGPRPFPVRWHDGFEVTKPSDLGRSSEGRLLRQLYRLSRRVRGRPPFDIGQLSADAGQSLDDWLVSGVAAFERWLGIAEHDGDETENAGLEGRHVPAA